jgi:2-polyprenyl-6-methoxyphenol hydroxylase-like FAD-dependent oxidoreductase
MNDTQVLVAGAGPTGPTLALSLARHSVRPRIVEKNAGPGEASRAMAVHARTLEFYRLLGSSGPSS